MKRFYVKVTEGFEVWLDAGSKEEAETKATAMYVEPSPDEEGY